MSVGLERKPKGEVFFFYYLKDQRAKVYYLEETHSEPANENTWKIEWGGKIFFSHGTKHSKGVCTLINPIANYQIDYSYTNTSGRISLVTINTCSI